MADGIVIEHDDRLYEIGIEDLAKYEVVDDDAKQELTTARDAGAEVPADAPEDEVEGFARRRTASTRAWAIIRR